VVVRLLLHVQGAFLVARGGLVGADAAGDVVEGVSQRLDGNRLQVDLHVLLLSF